MSENDLLAASFRAASGDLNAGRNELIDWVLVLLCNILVNAGYKASVGDNYGDPVVYIRDNDGLGLWSFAILGSMIEAYNMVDGNRFRSFKSSELDELFKFINS